MAAAYLLPKLSEVGVVSLECVLLETYDLPEDSPYDEEHLGGSFYIQLLCYLSQFSRIYTMELIDYDFIEIGTSNFDTLIQGADDTSVGLSVEPIKYYIDCLPDKKGVKKLNIAISDTSGEIDVYYIPEDIIVSNNLQDWFRGCNSVNKYHPLHIQHDVTHLCKIDRVPVITPAELFTQNNVRGVKYVKIDTEGHDCIILKSLHTYLESRTKDFYPKRILFETNEHTTVDAVDEIIYMYSKLGYVVDSRGYDTIMRFYK